MNRGIARRPMFEDRYDVRFFLSRVAREVRRGTLEVHSWCVLMNHYHMLVRSPAGELSEAMRRIQRDASRSYNRRHRRDGTLVRGRFRSKPVQSEDYATTLVRYIDFNPVRAGLVTVPWDYPWSSAAQFVRSTGPPWLERRWVERLVEADFVSGTTFPERYRDRFGRPLTRGACEVVEHRAEAPGMEESEDLFSAAPDRIAARMRARAARADGCRPGIAVADAASVLSVVAENEDASTIAPPARRLDPRLIATVGLLRGLAGAHWNEIATRTGRSRSTCHRAHSIHLERMQSDPGYISLVGRLGRKAIVRCFDDRSQRGVDSSIGGDR